MTLGILFIMGVVTLIVLNSQSIENLENNQTNEYVQNNEHLDKNGEEVTSITVPDQDNLMIETTMPKTYYQSQLDKFFITVEAKTIPLVKKQIDLNYSKGIEITPQYIVIHETNNYNAGADANAHYRYWSTNSTAQASTHFVVDDLEIYQMLELNQVAWHVGDNKGHSDITNFNSIGIEIAVNSDGDYLQARQNTIQLTINLMNHLNMDISQLKRHYDASGKYCPTYMLDHPELWTDFVAQVEKGLINQK